MVTLDDRPVTSAPTSPSERPRAARVPLALDVAGALALVAAAFAVYWRTLQPGPIGGDGGEFQFVPAILGIPHWTGYPLYVLAGKLWSLLPVGTVAYRMNLLSAVFGAGAVACTYLAARSLGAHPVPAAVGGVSVGATWLLWQWATIAGVRAGAVFFAALVLWLALRWYAAARRGDADGAGRALVPLALALGLSLDHHRSTIFWIPALAVFLLLARSGLRIDRRRIALVGVAFCAPLLLYLYLPIRAAMGAPYDQFHPNTLSGFFALVVAVGVSSGLLGVPPAEIPHRLGLLGSTLAREFGVATLAWCLAGAAVVARRAPAALGLMGVFAALLLAQVLLWNIGGDRLNDVYLMPLFPVAGVLAACGLDAVARVLRRLAPSWPLVPFAVLVGVVGLAGVVPVASAHRLERRMLASTPPDVYRQDLEWGRFPARLVASSLPYVEPRAVILADWEQAVLFDYSRLVEGVHPDALVDWGGGTEASADARRYLQTTDRPVYAVRPDDSLKGLHLTAVGPLIQVLRAPSRQLPAYATPKMVPLEDGMGLGGYALYDDEGRVAAHPAPLHTVAMVVAYWTTKGVPPASYSVSMQLARPGPSGSLDAVRKQDNGSPVYSLYPTTSWSPGEVVGDEYELDLRGLPAGAYEIVALLYQHQDGSFRNLKTLDAAGKPAGEQIRIATVEVASS